jgi:peptidoglycan/xylan/chitin deacetylase (PgdA/CDA1 family)
VKLLSPFNEINKNTELIRKYYLEDNFQMKFSLKHKFYYKFIRPVLPLFLRKKIQKTVNAKIICMDNFIFDEFVNLVNNKIDLQQIYLYPRNLSSALIITHDVEEQKGFNFIPRIIELEKKYGFKVSWNIVPYKYKIDKGIINLIREVGDEIGIHGFNHDGKLYYSEKIFNKRAAFINKAIEEYGAVGFRSPMVHRNLLWLQKLNIEYDASCFDYDPYQPFPGGTGSIWPFIAGKFVEIPYTLPQDHTLFYVLEQVNINIWKNKIIWLMKNKGVITFITHPDYLIKNKNFEIYKQLLDYLSSLENIWKCLPKEMATWWKENFEK